MSFSCVSVAAVPSPEASTPNLTGWILLCVFTHVLWGLYPVASRYLLVRAPQSAAVLDSVTLTVQS